MKNNYKKLKIAFLIDEFHWSLTFVFDKAIFLKEQGHQVKIFAQRIYKNKASPYKDFKKQILKLPRWDKLRVKDLLFGLIGALSFQPIITIKTILKILSTKENLTQKLYSLNLALPFLREKFDLIHIHFGYCASRYIDGLKILNTPLIITFNGSDLIFPPKQEAKKYKEVFERANLIIVVCENLRKKAIEMGVNEKKLILIYHGRDLDYFSYQERAFLNKLPVIVTVARLHWMKGLNYAIEAMKILNEKKFNFEYWLIGDGREREALEYMVNEYGLNKKVKFLGALSREQVREKLFQADIFLLTSLIGGGLGMSILEAQATGLPVVATRVGGIPEGIRDGETGFLVPPRNPEALAEKLKILIENPELRKQMGKKAREWVEKKFNQKILLEKLIDVYYEVIKEKK